MGLVLVAATAFAGPALAGDDRGWEALTTFEWGDGHGELGRRPVRAEELAWGPAGIALAPTGELAMVDRVNSRVILLDVDGRPVDERSVGERAGAATLLADGTLAVLDEGARRRVEMDGAGSLWSPRWAMPPHRLVSWTGDDGATVVEAMDAFQLRQPLAPASDPIAPHALRRGVPSPDGRSSAFAALDDEGFVVDFDGHAVPVGPWNQLDASAHPLASVEVLATDGLTAVLALEAVSAGTGPLAVDRLLATVDREGRIGTIVPAPAPGNMRIPGDLAALADGTVVTLVGGDDGCTLWRIRLPMPGEGVER